MGDAVLPIDAVEVDNNNKISSTFSVHFEQSTKIVLQLKVLLVDDSSMTRKMLKRLLQSLPADCVPGITCHYQIEDVENGLECIKHLCEHQSLHNNRAITDDSVSAITFKENIHHTRTDSLSVTNNSISVSTVPLTVSARIENNFIYQIIFIDNVMPGLSGPDTVRQLLSYYYKRSTRSCTPTNLGSSNSRRNSIREIPFIVGVSGLSDEKDIEEFKLAGANIVLVKPLDGKKLIQVLEQYHQWCTNKSV